MLGNIMNEIFTFKKQKDTETDTEIARKFHESLKIPSEERYEYYLNYPQKDLYLRKGGILWSQYMSGKYYRFKRTFKKIKFSGKVLCWKRVKIHHHQK